MCVVRDSLKSFITPLYLWRVVSIKKVKYFKLESTDGETHFQECKAALCANAKQYSADEAHEFSRREAEKPLILNRKVTK